MPTARCLTDWGRPKVNKFEQVSSLGHQMLLMGRSLYSEILCPEGLLYREVQCTMGSGHMGSPPHCEQTYMTENITLPPLHCQAVRMQLPLGMNSNANLTSKKYWWQTCRHQSILVWGFLDQWSVARWCIASAYSDSNVSLWQCSCHVCSKSPAMYVFTRVLKIKTKFTNVKLVFYKYHNKILHTIWLKCKVILWNVAFVHMFNMKQFYFAHE